MQIQTSLVLQVTVLISTESLLGFQVNGSVDFRAKQQFQPK